MYTCFETTESDLHLYMAFIMNMIYISDVHNNVYTYSMIKFSERLSNEKKKNSSPNGGGGVQYDVIIV